MDDRTLPPQRRYARRHPPGGTSPTTRTLHVTPSLPASTRHQLPGSRLQRRLRTRQGRGIEPWDIIAAWDLDFWEGNVLKYLLRRKPGVPRTEDLRKAMHYLEKCLERASAAENPAPLA